MGYHKRLSKVSWANILVLTLNKLHIFPIVMPAKTAIVNYHSMKVK